MGAATTISVVVIISSILIIVGYFGTQFFFKSVEVQRENTYCENWYNNIEDRRIQLENKLLEYENAGFWESLAFDTDHYNNMISELNAEVAEYNRQCYY